MGTNVTKSSADVSAVSLRSRTRSGSTVTTVATDTFNATREAQGVDLPGFRELIRDGKNATTTYFARDTRVKYFRPPMAQAVFQSAPDQAKTFVVLRDSGVRTMLPVSIPADLKAQANQSASSKFYGLYQTGPNTDLGVVAVELAETVSMLWQPYKHLVEAVMKRFSRARTLGDRISRSRSLRKLPTQRRLQAARRMWHDAYLETYFGMIPFVSEVSGLLSDLDAMLTKPPLVQVRVGHTSTKLESVNASTQYEGILMSFHTRMLHRYSVRYRGAYQAALSLDTDFSVPSTAADVAPALWEAMPYSWLLDYVFNVGHVLAAEQSAQALQWAWLCKTERYIRDDVVTANPTRYHPPSWWRDWAGVPGSIVVEHKIINRSAASAIVPPSLGLRHKPQTRIAALAAVASVVDARHLSNRDAKRFNRNLFT